MLRPGEQVDRYEVDSLVGQGGMAAVYKARHRHLGSVHALKMLLVSSPDVCARLLQEGRVQAALRHPNVVAVHDVFLVDRSPVLVMEFVDGPSLDRYLAGVALPLDEALAVFKGIVAGVGAAHAAGVVHRDLKPGNVLLASSPAGTLPKVMDFGLVRTVGPQTGVTQTGDLVGTPAYMAPEQIRDPATVDTRADLWALGCILYELTLGGLAFPDLDVFDLYDAIRSGRYIDPNETGIVLPDSVVMAIRDLLVVDREQRLASCSELHERLYDTPMPTTEPLQIALHGPAPSGATPVSVQMLPLEDPGARVGVPMAVPNGRRGVAAIAVVLALATLVLGGALWTRDRRDERVAEGRNEIGQAPLVEPATQSTPDPQPAAPEAAQPTPAPPLDRVVAVPSPVKPQRDRTQVQVAPPVPPPDDAVGSLVIEGDAAEVWLERAGQRFPVEGPFPPGIYTVFALFDDGTMTELSIRLPTEGALTLRCTSFHFACAAVKKPPVR